MKVETTTHATDTRTGAPHRTFVISQQQAAAWLGFLGELKRLGQSTTVLVGFRDSLADACWLARWSRNYVTLDVPVCELPTIVNDLANLVEHSLAKHPTLDQAQNYIGDEIIQSLSAY